jgi:plastocyanin
MKKILTLSFSCFIFLANAQTGMLNGTGYAPDISVTDINGNTHNLYSYLNSDKVVVLELMSTTCGHCQQYAAGTENSYQVYGPNGLDVAEFIALEVNAATSDNDLANFATTYGVSFPMCNGISPSAINYQLYYTPSYYVIYPDSSYVTFCPAYCQTTSSSSTIENLLNNAVQAWLPPVYGCTDPLASNYDSTATNDDGSCDYTSYTIITLGLTFSPDTIICDVGDTINFILGGYHNAVEVSNSTWLAGGTTSNGGFSFGFGATGQFISTTAQTYYYVCQPHVTSGMKGIIIANAVAINGCTDSTATNYDSTATVNDGSCIYACADNIFYMNMSRLYSYGWWSTTYTIVDTSGNIITSGTCDSLSSDVDTLCLIDGCFSVEISGYSPYGGCEASLWNITDVNGDTVAVQGDCYSYINLTNPVQYSGFYSVNFSVGNSSCAFYGCTDPVADNYWQSANTDDGSCFYFGCVDSLACNYNSIANINTWCDYSCFGCTDSTAINYDPIAIYDDSSCYYPIYGCIYGIASNYDPSATIDDGSCIYSSITITSPLNGDTVSGSVYSGSNTWANFQLSYITTNFSVPADGFTYETFFLNNLGGGGTYPDSSGVISLHLPIGTVGVVVQLISNTTNLVVATDSVVFYLTISGYGCTDSTAINYDAIATQDDGSCTYCTNPSPTGAYISELIHDRVRVNWDNMNDANCMVTQYRIKYRELGTSNWLSKTMANSGLCLFGLNTTSKKVVGLMPSTTYEYYMKAWYCGGGVSTWSAIQNFTTTDECENVINFAVSTPTTTKAEFTWDTTGAYSFARIKLRVDTTGGVWTSAGGFGVFYPALTKEKNGLNPGTSYRAQARTWCDPTGGAYRSAAWSPLVFWTQPTSVRLEGGSAINNLFIYPNPSRDIFNISFTSDTKQNLSVRIFNVIGEELINDKLEQFIGEYTKAIDLATYTKGVYILEITTNNGVVNKKLILQ